MGTSGSDAPVVVRSGVHGGAWVLANSMISGSSASSPEVRCILAPNSRASAVCASGLDMDMLLIKTDLRGRALDAALIGVPNSDDQGISLSIDTHTGAVYVLGRTSAFGECHDHLPCSSSVNDEQQMLLMRVDDADADNAGDPFVVRWAFRWHNERTFGGEHFYARPIDLVALGNARLVAVVNFEQVSVTNTSASLPSTRCARGQSCGGKGDVGLLGFQFGLNDSFTIDFEIQAGTMGEDVAVAAAMTNYGDIAVAATVANSAIGVPSLSLSGGVLEHEDDDVVLLNFASLRCAKGEEPRRDIAACARCEPGRYSTDGSVCLSCDAESSVCEDSEFVAGSAGPLRVGRTEPLSRAGWQRVKSDTFGAPAFEFQKCFVASDASSSCAFADACVPGHMRTEAGDRMCASCAEEFLWSRGRCEPCYLKSGVATLDDTIGVAWRLMRLGIFPLIIFCIVRIISIVARRRLPSVIPESGARREEEDRESIILFYGLFRVCMCHYQTLLSILHGVVAPWPSSVMTFFAAFDVFDTVASLSEALECVMGGSCILSRGGITLDKALLSASLVALFSSSLWFAYYVRRIWIWLRRLISCCSDASFQRRHGITKPTARDFENLSRAREEDAKWRHRARIFCVWIAVVAYIPTTRAIVDALPCRSLGHSSMSHLVLVANPSEDCPETLFTLATSALLIVFVVCYPFAVKRLVRLHLEEQESRPWLSRYAHAWPLQVMWRRPDVDSSVADNGEDEDEDERVKSSSKRETTRFLFLRAETVDILRQQTFAVLVPLLMRDSKEQILLCLMLCVVTAITWSFLRPFRSESIRTANLMSVGSLMLTLIAALVFRIVDVQDETCASSSFESTRVILSMIVITSNFGVLGYSLYAYAATRCSRRSRSARSERSADKIEMHVPLREYATNSTQTDAMSETLERQYEMRGDIIEIYTELRHQCDVREGNVAFDAKMKKKFRALGIRGKKYKRVYAALMRRAEDVQGKNFELYNELKKLGKLAFSSEEISDRKKKGVSRLESASKGLERLPSLA
eukprot:g975.t1